MTWVGSTFLDFCLLFLTIVLDRLDLRDAHVRANLADLISLNPGRNDSADGHDRGIDPGQQQLRRLFGLGERRSTGRFERDLTMTSFVSDATELNVHQINLIGELKNAVQKGNARERTAATLTLLKLCESGWILLMNQTQTHVHQLRSSAVISLVSTCWTSSLVSCDVRTSRCSLRTRWPPVWNTVSGIVCGTSSCDSESH